MNQERLKQQAGQAAVRWVPEGAIIGVGSGSTVHYFIDALAARPGLIQAAVSSSQASTARLQRAGVSVVDANSVEQLAVYVDGADEIDAVGRMVKGGGGALTREKLLASLAPRFVCVVDASKWVDRLGVFPVPIEVIPSAAAAVARRLVELGGVPELRVQHDVPFVTDNGLHILDVRQLKIDDPLAMELTIQAWPGVLTCGIFARQKASMCIAAGAAGVRVCEFGGV